MVLVGCLDVPARSLLAVDGDGPSSRYLGQTVHGSPFGRHLVEGGGCHALGHALCSDFITDRSAPARGHGVHAVNAAGVP
jgi:hypothetical protein